MDFLWTKYRVADLDEWQTLQLTVSVCLKYLYRWRRDAFIATRIGEMHVILSYRSLLRSLVLHVAVIFSLLPCLSFFFFPLSRQLQITVPRILRPVPVYLRHCRNFSMESDGVRMSLRLFFIKNSYSFGNVSCNPNVNKIAEFLNNCLENGKVCALTSHIGPWPDIFLIIRHLFISQPRYVFVFFLSNSRYLTTLQKRRWSPVSLVQCYIESVDTFTLCCSLSWVIV